MSAFDVFRGAVNSWECDQMGHMNVQFYVARMSHAWSHIRLAVGYAPDHLKRDRTSLVAVRDVIHYKRELHAGDAMHMTARVVEVGDKSIRFLAELWKTASGELSAAFDSTALHFDLEARKAAPLPPAIRDKARALVRPIPDLRPLPETDARFMALADEDFIDTYRGSVNVWECDYLGHMNVQFYTDRFSHAAGQLFAKLALPRERHVGSAAVQYDVRYLKELRAGSPILLRSTMLDVGNKTLRFGHRLYNSASGELAATADIVGVTFDLKARKAIAVPDEVRAAAQKLMAKG